jgi:hypothetical protein
MVDVPDTLKLLEPGLHKYAANLKPSLMDWRRS